MAENEPGGLPTSRLTLTRRTSVSYRNLEAATFAPVTVTLVEAPGNSYRTSTSPQAVPGTDAATTHPNPAAQRATRRTPVQRITNSPRTQWITTRDGNRRGRYN